MMYFKKHILIVLMITVNCLLFNYCVIGPTNQRFILCTKQMLSSFRDFHKVEDLLSPDSPLISIKNAILDLSIKDDLNSDTWGYFTKFSGQAKSDGIKDIETFCVDITNEVPGNYKDIHKEICTKKLAVFGSKTDEILDNAILQYRLSYTYEELDFVFWDKTFGMKYLRHIAENVNLKDNSSLATPWQYCCDAYPDKQQAKGISYDQVLTSNEGIN